MTPATTSEAANTNKRPLPLANRSLLTNSTLLPCPTWYRNLRNLFLLRKLTAGFPLTLIEIPTPARRVVDALAARLREDDGPEIVIVLPRRGNNRLERETMDSARHLLTQALWAADEHRRLGVYWPVTDGGAPIYVHSKVRVVDDRPLAVALR